MSINYLISTLTSTEGKQLYSFPKNMQSVMRLVVGNRSLRYGVSTIDGEKYIVLLEPLELTGIKIIVFGR